MISGMFGRYEIRQELGRGGMAQVYLAHDPTFRRQVAIKVLPPHYLENPLLRARFEREARLIATIEHPAIVPVYDFGEQGNQLYLVMRYMPGGSLVALIRQGALTLARVSELLSQLAPALEAVHARGIVHRDLKPGNILFDAFGNPALSDFGIAHLSEGTVDLTGEAIIGTPAYMSPEQVRGEVALDGRSDIYALGIVVYEMLTGKLPFQAATPMSAAMRHLTDPLPEIRRLRPELPQPLQSVLEKALAKDRDQRYAQASEFAYDLRALVDAYATKDYPQAAPRAAAETQLDKPTTGTVLEVDSDQGATRLDSEDEADASADAALEPAAPPQARAAPGDAQSPAGAAPFLSRIPRLGWLALAALAVVLAIFVVPRLGGWLPGGEPEATPALTPAVTLASSASPTAKSIFADDFSVPANGWPEGSTAEGGYAYQNGQYSISVLRSGSLYWAAPDGRFTDLSVRVTAGSSSGEQGYYGLLCRIQDAENYYYFILRPDGYYTIGKSENGSLVALTPGGWTYHAAILTGEASNELQAECSGDALRLWANGELLGEARDSDIQTGRSGLIAAALDEAGFQVIFDNFMVLAPLP